MPRPPFLRPDVLVLAGGGVLGELWMHGVLSGMQDAAGVDFREVESFVGTSAGSILAARLVAGVAPKRPSGVADHDHMSRTDGPTPTAARRPAALRAAAAVAARAWGATTPLAPRVIAAPGGAVLRAAVLSRVPHGTHRLDALHAAVARSSARFDGRLRICAVDMRRGRRVVFGAPGAPRASVADAVVASCAIPAWFAPVTIGGRAYVDGGAWSITNLDAAPAGRHTRVLCLDPTATIAAATTRAGALRQAFRVGAALEMQALRRRGSQVWRFGPDRDCGALMANLMDEGPGERVLAAGWRQGVALSER